MSLHLDRVAHYQKPHSSASHPSSTMIVHDAGRPEQWVKRWKKINLHHLGILMNHDWKQQMTS
jgi:hypothetical protein